MPNLILTVTRPTHYGAGLTLHILPVQDLPRVSCAHYKQLWFLSAPLGPFDTSGPQNAQCHRQFGMRQVSTIYYSSESTCWRRTVPFVDAPPYWVRPPQVLRQRGSQAGKKSVTNLSN